MANIEQTRAVVEPQETFDGRIIPTVRAELDRPVRLREGATVQGSVYGKTVETYPESTVEGSLMASEAVKMKRGHVCGEIGTPGKVVATEGRVDGTVTGKRVRLTDCVVRGNVVGTEVILENSVVLGIVTAERKLAMEESLCYTFRGHGKTALKGVTTVLPQAICDGTLELETPVSVAGLGELDVGPDDRNGQRTDTGDRLPRMTEADLYEQDETKYLSLAPRVLNLAAVTDRLEELERGIRSAVTDASDDEGATASVSEVLASLDIDVDVATLAD